MQTESDDSQIESSEMDALFVNNNGEIKLKAAHIFDRLLQEIITNSLISRTVKSKLECSSLKERREIVNQTKDECSPLFLAAQKGLVDIVNYLINVCDADIEQRGMYEVSVDGSKHNVTPLWCAVVAGKLDVVKTLVQHGACVNSVSDTGSTPVRSACFMTHMEIVKFLVQNGADIVRPNYNGGTCLINSVQSVELCQFLIRHNVNVNAHDIQAKTALHYAIQEHLFDTTKLLLNHGADPYLKSRYGDDALQIACLKGNVEIFYYLIQNASYDNKRLAEAHELIGTTFLDERHDIYMALQYWRKGLEIRNSDPSGSLGKPKDIAPRIVFLNAVEFNNEEELENIAVDLDTLHVQSLLICERVLGSLHKDTIFRLMYRGAAYADTLRNQRCVDLWKLALQLRIQKDTILHSETCFTAQAFVRLCVEILEKHKAGIQLDPLRFSDILDCIRLLTNEFEVAIQLLKVRPIFKRQLDNFYRLLKMVLYLLHVSLCIPKTESNNQELKRCVNNIIRLDPRTSCGYSLLHLAVCQGCSVLDNYNQSLFPSSSVTRLLLQCGANVNVENHSRSTPLHLAAKHKNFDHDVVQILLNFGAHIDIRNKSNEMALTSLQKIPSFSVNVLKYITLKCLAARTIIKYKLPYKGEIPETLEDFIIWH